MKKIYGLFLFLSLYEFLSISSSSLSLIDRCLYSKIGKKLTSLTKNKWFWITIAAYKIGKFCVKKFTGISKAYAIALLLGQNISEKLHNRLKKYERHELWNKTKGLPNLNDLTILKEITNELLFKATNFAHREEELYQFLNFRGACRTLCELFYENTYSEIDYSISYKEKLEIARLASAYEDTYDLFFSCLSSLKKIKKKNGYLSFLEFIEKKLSLNQNPRKTS